MDENVEKIGKLIWNEKNEYVVPEVWGLLMDATSWGGPFKDCREMLLRSRLGIEEERVETMGQLILDMIAANSLLRNFDGDAEESRGEFNAFASRYVKAWASGDHTLEWDKIRDDINELGLDRNADPIALAIDNADEGSPAEEMALTLLALMMDRKEEDAKKPYSLQDGFIRGQLQANLPPDVELVDIIVQRKPVETIKDRLEGILREWDSTSAATKLRRLEDFANDMSDGKLEL